MYNSAIQELWQEPLHRWSQQTSQEWAVVESWQVENPVCGDRVELFLCRPADQTQATSCALFHRSLGCPPVLAVAEFLCRCFASQQLNQQQKMQLDWSSLEPIPPNKKHALAMGRRLAQHLLNSQSMQQ